MTETLREQAQEAADDALGGQEAVAVLRVTADWLDRYGFDLAAEFIREVAL